MSQPAVNTIADKKNFLSTLITSTNSNGDFSNHFAVAHHARRLFLDVHSSRTSKSSNTDSKGFIKLISVLSSAAKQQIGMSFTKLKPLSTGPSPIFHSTSSLSYRLPISDCAVRQKLATERWNQLAPENLQICCTASHCWSHDQWRHVQFLWPQQ